MKNSITDINEETIKEIIRQSYIVGLLDGNSGISKDNDSRTLVQVERLYNETIKLERKPIDRNYIVIELSAKNELDIGKHLQKMVGVWMKKGFVPSGGAFTTENKVLQPMVKKQSSDIVDIKTDDDLRNKINDSLERMDKSITDYTNTLLLVPAMACLAAEIGHIIHSSHGSKEDRKKVVDERINQAINGLIDKMPHLAEQLNELKQTLTKT